MRRRCWAGCPPGAAGAHPEGSRRAAAAAWCARKARLRPHARWEESRKSPLEKHSGHRVGCGRASGVSVGLETAAPLEGSGEPRWGGPSWRLRCLEQTLWHGARAVGGAPRARVVTCVELHVPGPREEGAPPGCAEQLGDASERRSVFLSGLRGAGAVEVGWPCLRGPHGGLGESGAEGSTQLAGRVVAPAARTASGPPQVTLCWRGLRVRTARLFVVAHQ